MFTKIFMHVANSRGSVLLRQSNEIPREGAVLGVFYPTNNALNMYNIAFETHTQTAEPIEMPFGIMSGLGSRNDKFRGGDDPEGERAIFWETCARQA